MNGSAFGIMKFPIGLQTIIYKKLKSNLGVKAYGSTNLVLFINQDSFNYVTSEY